jgi:hypothetical protein
MMLDIRVLVWDRHKNMAELNQLNGIPTFPLLVIESPTAIQI